VAGETVMDRSAPAREVSKRLPVWVAIVLIAVTLIYALFAGLRTLTDFDLGWQLATGRWIFRNHQIPSTDVFSYTAQGQPWIYPVLSGLVFYAVFLAGGYALLSWLGATACVGTVGLLIRRGSLATGALAILAIPRIAARTAPRADMFTTVLFAAFLSLIWENFQTGRARLWLLPVLMVAWVNLHLGFVAGLMLVGAYAIVELLETLFAGERRRRAVERLRHAWPWLLATFPATFLNPWGWNLFVALVRQNRAMAEHAQWIREWASPALNWNAIVGKFSLQNTEGAFLALLAVAVLATALALFLRQPGAALLLGGASYLGMRYVRFQALFGCLVALVGGWVFSSAWEALSSRWRDVRVRTVLAAGVAAMFVLLALARSADLVFNHRYLAGSETATFGAGLSWWFPERALAFIERQHLPAEVFNNYSLGGFLVWRLGEHYRDYVDGRAIPFGPAVFQNLEHLMRADPDGPEWQRETNLYGMNTLVLTLARYDGDAAVLPKFCNSQTWRPVYLDEVSDVFLRQTPENESLLQRFGLDCSKAALRELEPGANRAMAFNYWANSMVVLHSLGRSDEAWAASEKALYLFPESAHLRTFRATMLTAMGHLQEAEHEYQAALAIEPRDVIWASLASLYRMEGRSTEADQAIRKAVDLSTQPHQILTNLAFSCIRERLPKDALVALDEAARRAPPEAATNKQFQIDLLRGRAMAWNALGQGQKAISFQEEAARIGSDRPDVWLELAQLYEWNGRREDAQRARSVAANAGGPKH